jgi:hypothetical protein
VFYPVAAHPQGVISAKTELQMLVVRPSSRLPGDQSNADALAGMNLYLWEITISD